MEAKIAVRRRWVEKALDSMRGEQEVFNEALVASMENLLKHLPYSGSVVNVDVPTIRAASHRFLEELESAHTLEGLRYRMRSLL